MWTVSRFRIGIIAVLNACVGYSDTSVTSLAPDGQVVEVDGAAGTEQPVASDSVGDSSSEEVDAGAVVVDQPDAPLDEVTEVDNPLANVRLARNEQFDGYLTNSEGRPLYMFADDVAAAGASTCLGACAEEWPPFDVVEPIAGKGLVPSEIQRFHRQDGLWQTTFKGHPLYYRKSEASAVAAVAGDGKSEASAVAVTGDGA